MKKSIFLRIGTAVLALLFISSITSATTYQKSLWVWNTTDVIGVTIEENRLLNECNASSITDLYLYLQSGTVTTNQVAFQNFIEKCTCKNIRVWGMDGWRGYFSDQCGPGGFYKVINTVISYNSKSTAKQQFFGFAGDNEFVYQDASGDCVSPSKSDAFHYGSTDAGLSKTAGSGFWKSTAQQDRDSLCTDWVKQSHDAAFLCHQAGLQYSIAVYGWITGTSYSHASMGFQNTPLYAYYKGEKKELYKALMDYVDEYVIMSYHTNVANKVALMCKDPLSYANTLPAATRPRILSAIETFCGVDQYVSYCDTPPQNNKSSANYGISQHISYLGGNESYSGVGIHDWVGWKDLSPASSNTANITCVSGIEAVLSLSEIQLTPNPATNQVELTVGNLFEAVTITVIGMNGVTQIVTQIPANSVGKLHSTIDVANLSSGLYLLKLSGNFNDKTIKFMKH